MYILIPNERNVHIYSYFFHHASWPFKFKHAIGTVAPPTVQRPPDALGFVALGWKMLVVQSGGSKDKGLESQTLLLPSRELTYPANGRGNSSSQLPDWMVYVSFQDMNPSLKNEKNNHNKNLTKKHQATAREVISKRPLLVNSGELSDFSVDPGGLCSQPWVKKRGFSFLEYLTVVIGNNIINQLAIQTQHSSHHGELDSNTTPLNHWIKVTLRFLERRHRKSPHLSKTFLPSKFQIDFSKHPIFRLEEV